MPNAHRSITAALWFRSVGIFLLGLTAATTAGTSFVLVRNDAARAQETDCVREINNNAMSLQGEINTQGWVALLRRANGQMTDDEAQQVVIDMSKLAQQWRVADGRRQRVDELC